MTSNASASLNAKASQETLISLLQLDPAPIDNASVYEKELPPLPEESMKSFASTITPPSAHSTSSLGLSGSAHGPIFYLTRIHRYSSYTFAFFAGLHITNTSLIPLLYRSVPYSEPFLLLSRELYQTRLGEPLLVALPILAHVASGFAIRLVKRHQNLKRYGGATPGVWALRHAKTSNSNMSTSTASSSSYMIWPPLSYISISGYAFLVVLTSHVAMNRILPVVVEGDSSNIGLQYVSHGFARHPVQAWITYTLLLCIGAGHMVWGGAKWLDLAPRMGWRTNTIDKQIRKRRRRTWWTIQGLTLAIAGIWAAGGLGIVARGGKARGWLGTVYDGIYNWAGQ